MSETSPQRELTRLRGFQDLLGPDAAAVSLIEQRARAIMQRYAVDEIRLPLLEREGLYKRSSGETSDIVEKQMYSFADRDEAHTMVALRPEGTPGVVRAYIDAGLDRSEPEQRFFYTGPMFRRERPQKGRYRQHYQFGVEIFGRADPACDAELLIMIDDLRRELGLSLETQINSLGCAQCRPAFRAALLEFGRAHLAELCEDCHARLERNPIRLLDCKIDTKLMESAPSSLDYLCEACRKHFDTVIDLIKAGGVPYAINPRMVRGLDYYTRTTFEVVSLSVGAQSTVVAGGRYDGLVESLGGAPVPGIGFAIGLDRMALALTASGAVPKPARSVALIALGAAALPTAMLLARDLRAQSLRVEVLAERGLKALMRRADKIGARFAVIIGDNEVSRNVVQLRDLRASTQREVRSDDLVKELLAGLRDE
ncbi:MAG: histidine--tRNA ligase [Candidatus Binatales bacterium]